MSNNNRVDRGKNRKAGNVTLSAEEQRQLLADQLKIRPKTKAVVDEILSNPKVNHTDAYMKHHKTTNRASARASVSKLLAKPNVGIYKDAAVRKAKERIVSLVDTKNESIALKASQDILDRTEGKAIQRNETTSKSVEVKLDLGGVRIGAHYLQAAQDAIESVN